MSNDRRIRGFEDLDCWKACRAEILAKGRELVDDAIKLVNGYVK